MLKDEWGPEETQVLRGDADNILLHSAADAIERRDVEIKQLEAENQRLTESLATGKKRRRRAIDRADKAEAELAKYKTALGGLTVGRSEYSDNPERCAAVILWRLKYLSGILKKTVQRAEKAEIERARLLERDMRLCVLINENTPPGAQPCTVDMLEGAVKWLCWELHRLLTLAREFKAELYGAGGERGRT